MPAPAQLTPAAFARAAAFLHASRPLERALFLHQFDSGPADAARRELERFQNDDGGFHHLEADMDFPVSSVLSTCRALHLHHELGTGATESSVQRALGYLLATFDPAHGAWRIIPPHDNSRPHAPWWHCGDDFANQWGGYVDNPRPDVLAVLHVFADKRTEALRQAVARQTIERLRAQTGPMDMHGLLCYLRLHAAPGLAPELRAALDARLPDWIDLAVERDRAKWSGYGLRPLDVAPTADSPWRSLVAAAAEQQLDYLIANQAEDGSWHPHWNWGDHFPEAWPAARRQWQAVLTLANLATLRSYGRIAA